MNQEVSKMAESSVRLPICADDRWYPSRTAALRDDVSGYIERGPVLDLPGRVIGLVAPHAGYFFSGHVAGAAWPTPTSTPGARRWARCRSTGIYSPPWGGR
jgi:hypothetical protein